MTVSGRVQGENGKSLGAVRVELLDTPIQPENTFADGVFSLAGAAAGRAGRLLFHRKPGYGVRAVDIMPQVLPGNIHPQFAELPTADEIFATSGGFTPSSSAWTWGSAPAGPDSCFSMPGCWGVGYFGDYHVNQNASLTSPAYSFPDAGNAISASTSGATPNPATTESGWNCCRARRVVIEPAGGYDYPSVAALGGTPGWSGRQGDWRGVVFDLSGRELSSFQFRLLFRADETVSYRGFFIDDVTFDTGATFVDAPPASPAAPTLTAHPNPFNPRTTIRWAVPAAGLSRLEIFDARGRRVACWPAPASPWARRFGMGRTTPAGRKPPASTW